MTEECVVGRPDRGRAREERKRERGRERERERVEREREGGDGGGGTEAAEEGKEGLRLSMMFPNVRAGGSEYV